MTQIFVSYSRESQDIVKTMVKDIEDLGHNVWFDQELTGGQAWWDQILDRIRKCNIFVYALTLEALEPHACQLELDYAYKLNKTILPILVADGVSTNLLPTALSEIQFVDYRHKDKQAVIAVNKAINNLPAQQPLPDPLPESPIVPTSYLGNLSDQIELQHGGKVVYDHESGLMWQQSGSGNHMTYENANTFIDAMNRQGSASYNDWRLPTLEEAMSLMEPIQNNDDRYINSKFDSKQRHIWASDSKSGYWPGGAWIVTFYDGKCSRGETRRLALFIVYSFVRAVR